MPLVQFPKGSMVGNTNLILVESAIEVNEGITCSISGLVLEKSSFKILSPSLT